MLDMIYAIIMFVGLMYIVSYIIGKILGKAYKNIILISSFLACGEMILRYVFIG